MAHTEVIQARKIQHRKNAIPRRKLGELLVETGLLRKEKLIEALKVQKETGKRLGQVLIDMKLVSEEEIAFSLAMQLKIPFVDLSDHEIQEHLIQSIPEEVSRKFACIPIALKSNILDVAMSDPLDLNMIKDLQFITGYSIQPAISTASQIMESLQKHYHPERTIDQVAQEFNGEDIMEFLPEREMEEEDDEPFDVGQDSPFIKMVDLIIRNAIYIIFLGMIVSTLLAIWIGRGLTKPISRLTSSVRDIERGNLDIAVESTSLGEIGTLEQGVKSMLGKNYNFQYELVINLCTFVMEKDNTWSFFVK